MAPHKAFGDRLAQERREKSSRERRDILQKDVAKVVGTTPTTLSRWEKGEVLPRDDALYRLARYFGVTPAWLRYGQAPREASPDVDIPVLDTRPKKPARGKRKLS